ncbi:MAG: hypothetical protein FJX11_19475 [Alphaproteobacteria bacterium]|nr:hypothetical protein [Alphaproteobacteria bacterium]
MIRRLIALAALLPVAALAQLPGPPPGGVLHPFVAPPAGLQQDFVGTWQLAWDDPVDPACPCHAILTIQPQADGELRGHWPIKGGVAVLTGGVAFDGNVWAGRFSQSDEVDFPIKGHFRLETRDNGRALTGSYQRDGTAIPFRWTATRR